MNEPTLSDVVNRLDKMDRRFNSIDQRLERVEGRTELTSERLSLLHERLDIMDQTSKQRFDRIEATLQVVLRSLNGHGS